MSIAPDPRVLTMEFGKQIARNTWRNFIVLQNDLEECGSVLGLGVLRVVAGVIFD